MRSTSIALLAASAAAPGVLGAPRAGAGLPTAIYKYADAIQQIPFSVSPEQHQAAAGKVEEEFETIASAFESALRNAGEFKDAVAKEAEGMLSEVEGIAGRVMQEVAYGVKKVQEEVVASVQKIEVEGVDYERITLSSFPDYAVRVRSPEGLCDTSVKQYSGYLDFDNGKKHLFFWFFESRNKPKTDPLVLWLNGGPGCSSSTGMLMELGPCSATKNGSTEYNEYGWNTNANLLFLDQPVAVGYSYSEGESINNSEDAAKDVYAFLQLFYQKFDQYSKLPFTVAAESYGGKYAPAIANRIFQENKKLASGAVHIPLSTVMIGNGLTEPLTQFASTADYGCAPSPYAIFDETTCASLRSKIPTCQRLQQYCYDSPGRFTCVPATLYCWQAMYAPLQATGLNPYDVRQKCDRSANPLCYDEMNWIEKYLNRPEIKKELGVDSSIKFASCNMEVNRGFQLNGDNMHNSETLLPELLENGVRLLIYAGEDDAMCNYLGNERWMLAADTPFTKEFAEKKGGYYPSVNVKGGKEGKVAGTVRSAGPGAGNYSYVSLYESGHMVPHDQPEIALDLLNRWLANEPLV